MENQKLNFWTGMNPAVKKFIMVLILLAGVYTAYKFDLIPGIKSAKSKTVAQSNISTEGIDVHSEAVKMKVPDINDLQFANVEDRIEWRIMNWTWFANAPLFTANYGPLTMKGSLMDQYKLRIRMITNNSVSDMKREQLAFINEYFKGNKNPSVGVNFVTLMGDGYTSYIAAMNKQLKKAFGPEYVLKAISIIGFSMGEDCGIGPKEWIDNPQLMRGAVICAVIGDGDWGLIVRLAGDNKIPINPDPTTYDPNAINFVPAPNDDFLKAAEQVIAGRTVTLTEKDSKGELTGKKVTKPIQAAATWFPGDRNMFKSLNLVKTISTVKYPNQMAAVIVGCDKWMKENSKQIVDFLSATLTASNQIKQHDEWFHFAAQLAPKVFCVPGSDCTETAEDWYKFGKPGGGKMKNTDSVIVSTGGTQMANLSDNKKYFGMKGGNNFYKSVYDYFNGVLKDLNPGDFMASVGELVPYEEAVDLSYLQKVTIDAGVETRTDYSKNKGEVFAKRAYKIEFTSGSYDITESSAKELEELFKSINTAEQAIVEIIGHTDNVGDKDQNLSLSLKRAKAVKKWLMDRSNNSYPAERFNTDGKGDSVPVASNATDAGRKQNRRVEIRLLQ